MTKISNLYALTSYLTADLVNNRIGINISSPTTLLDVNGTGRFTGALTGTSATFSGNLGLGATSSAYKLRILTDNTLDNGVYISGGTGNTNHAVYVENKAGTAEYFAVRGDGQIRLGANGVGNVLINTTTDAGYKLDVNGTGRFGSNSANGDLIINSNSTPLIIRGRTPYELSYLALSWDISPNAGLMIGNVLKFNTNATIGTNVGSTALTLATTGAATFSSSVTATSFGASGQISTSNGVDTDLLINVTAAGAATKYSSIQSSVSGRNLTLNPTNGGNVGIGTTNPTFSSGGGLNITNASAAVLRVNATGYTGLDVIQGSDGTGYLWNRDNNEIRFGTNNSERMRITSGGDVLVGTTATDTGRVQIKSSGGGTNYGHPLLLTDNSALGNALLISIRNGESRLMATYNAGATNCDMTFWNTQSNGNQFERLRLTADGYFKFSDNGSFTTNRYANVIENSIDDNVLVAYAKSTGFTSTVFVPYTIRAAGTSCLFMYGVANGTNTLKIFNNGNIQNTNNSYGAISDIKLKENITDATPKLADLLKVKVKNFNFIGSNDKQLGVIAQELEEVFPGLVEDLVDRDEQGNALTDTTKSVKYSVFVPMLIKAIQELSAKVTALENK